jgi:phosphoribosylformimino-5-aminoimidazole carboxamide ribotide isomerase
LKIIPVIDVLNGKVVHAIRGKRKEYLPLRSTLTNSFDPSAVAQAFKTLGFNELYLADLDAILGKQPNYKIYKNITEMTSLKLIVDAGINNLTTAEQILNNQATKLIIGTETLPNKKLIQEMIKHFDTERLIISLDLMNNKVLTKPKFDGPKEALDLLRELNEIGVLQFIILDLARVGSNEGININFLKKALSILQGNVYVGGGVRDVADLIELKTLGIAGVLVATALHSGKISINDLKQASLI